MPTPTIQHLKTLRFSGGRFEQTLGWLDFDALTELQAYQKILIETASEGMETAQSLSGRFPQNSSKKTCTWALGRFGEGLAW